jgi:hydrophobic/amphiphilic exporter-1 (mainly G- bacteria), HAE1 family
MNPLRAFLRFFAAHPTAPNLLMVLFFFVGILSLPGLVRETFPDFASTEVEVSIPYPGATAEEVEQGVCIRVEEALEELSDIVEVRSEAREGIARIVAEMREGGDSDRFLTDVKTEVEAIDDFPDETEKPIIKQLGRTDLVVSVAVTGPMSVPDLKAYSEEVKDRLMRLEEISQVEVRGFPQHQIRVEIPADTLMRYGLSLSEIAERIRRQSLDFPSGTVETSQEDVVIRFADERRSIRGFEELTVLSGATGAAVRLGDIATITDRFDPEEDKVLFNGKRAGLLVVKKTKDQDALEILDAIHAFLEQERQTAPPTVEYTLTQNISSIVRDRLQMLSINGMEGLILVFLTMWLFFSFRFSFWVAMGLPVSFMGAFFGMQLIGFSLNMLTMVGLLMGIGLLMDDAIVISENVAAQVRKGKSPLQAAVDGTAEVAPGIISSFLTTVLVFGSVAILLEGHMGRVLWVMPVVLILVLGFSLVEAFCILPAHLTHALKKGGDGPGRLQVKVDVILDTLREKYLGRAVDWTVEHRYLFLGLVLTLFLLSVGMVAGGRLKMQAFPEIDGDVLEARILLPQGTPLERTEAVARRVADALTRVNKELTPLQPEGQSLVQYVSVRFGENLDAYEAGAHLVTVAADLLGAEKRETRLDDITALWRKETGVIPDVISLTYKEPVIGPAGLAIDIRLQGSDLDQLKQASLELMDRLNEYRGVMDLNDDLRPGKPEILVRANERALALGMDGETIARQLRTAFFGATAAEFQAGPESYEVDVRLAPSGQPGLSDLDRFYLTASDGRQIPLAGVADLEQSRGYARIFRVDSVRTVTVRGDVDSNTANEAQIISEVTKNFLPNLQKRYPGVTFSLEGQTKESGKTSGSLQTAMLVALFGIFLLLSLQFHNYVVPLAIMSAIPLAFIGVVWGHLLMGLELSMPSIMGYVSLAGVVVNNSILLAHFIRMRTTKGENAATAAKAASRLRFRAVLLTTLTTIMGLAPLLLERSLQAQILIPLAVSLVFGLLAASILVLLVLPPLYALLDDFGVAEGGGPRN